MITAENPLRLTEGALVQRKRLLQPPRLPVKPGEVVAGSQRVRVRLPRTCSKSARVRSSNGIASPTRPAFPVGGSEVSAETQGGGMRFPQHARAIGEAPLKERNRVLNPRAVLHVRRQGYRRTSECQDAPCLACGSGRRVSARGAQPPPPRAERAGKRPQGCYGQSGMRVRLSPHPFVVRESPLQQGIASSHPARFQVRAGEVITGP